MIGRLPTSLPSGLHMLSVPAGVLRGSLQELLAAGLEQLECLAV